MEKQWIVGSKVLTFSQRYEGDVVGENAFGNGLAGGDAGVVAAVGGVHLGDIEVTRYLGDKTPLVQRDEGGEFIEDPSERQLGCTERDKTAPVNQDSRHTCKTFRKSRGDW